jgi:P2-related tail formation protein
MGNQKIFIQIASYRDPQLLVTLKDCIEKSKYPENLVFSIAWQHSVDDEWDNLSEYANDSRFKIIDILFFGTKHGTLEEVNDLVFGPLTSIGC